MENIMKFTETVCYVSEYRVERCYGGPEEGGWYYDWRDFVKTVAACTDEESAYSLCRALNAAERREAAERGDRGRGSVIGGPDTEFTVEDHPGEEQTTHRPHYE